MNHKFELEDERIYLITEINVWDGAVERRDVTDELLPIINQYLNQNLPDDYKRINGVITYIGEGKTPRGEI
ncbi:hypothetical protein FKN04_22945 [Bacillus glycinifermentans]|uniref:hypothetical protein n=1 Tax=Bacillus TaxID=1386 RepID=UPI001584319B|nr:MULTISPECIES: hypothetical protein [Bacillus]NUJ19391.1 hypothetical protein [Bacillus glycinifermentans]GIN67130.1 hypothetical protein J41TS2_25510 [Bacillus sonorensis]